MTTPTARSLYDLMQDGQRLWSDPYCLLDAEHDELLRQIVYERAVAEAARVPLLREAG